VVMLKSIKHKIVISLSVNNIKCVSLTVVQFTDDTGSVHDLSSGSRGLLISVNN
jgi:hypothetical protein